MPCYRGAEYHGRGDRGRGGGQGIGRELPRRAAPPAPQVPGAPGRRLRLRPVGQRHGGRSGTAGTGSPARRARSRRRAPVPDGVPGSGRWRHGRRGRRSPGERGPGRWPSAAFRRSGAGPRRGRLPHPRPAVLRPHRREPPGSGGLPVCDVRRPGGLLPALGQPGRPDRAPCVRGRHPRARGALGPGLHRPAARRALAGRGRRPAGGPYLPAAGGHGAVRLHRGRPRRAPAPPRRCGR